jgi:hypothetical protein
MGKKTIDASVTPKNLSEWISYHIQRFEEENTKLRLELSIKSFKNENFFL